MNAPPAGSPLKRLRISDLRGVTQLATEATAGVTRIVEAVHRSVLDVVGLPGAEDQGRTRGITGLVYNSVYGVTRLVGHSADKALTLLQPLLESTRDPGPDSPSRVALLAALNGVMGDRLSASGNPFATPMSLRYRGEALDWQTPPPMPEANGRVLVLLHGLCISDLQEHARHKGHATDHGEALASALGYTPVYVRYNSGLHTSSNGRELSAQLERLVTHWPTPVEELTVVAYSMGGLLIRSACHGARQEGLGWPDRLKNILFVGTPHHGAPLERAGNWVDAILGSTPYTAPFARLGQLRSAGITDLRHGHVVEQDWHGHDRFHRRPDQRRVVPLPEGVNCYTMAATTAARRSCLADRLLGDGLVPLNSALGRHDDRMRSLAFPAASRRIAYRTNHLGLLNSHEVTQQMVQWLSRPG